MFLPQFNILDGSGKYPKLNILNYFPVWLYKLFTLSQQPVIPVTMDPELVKRIDDYRRTVHWPVPSRSEAILRLVDEGLSKFEKKSKK